MEMTREMSHVTPILVQLYDTHRLYALARDRTPSARNALAQLVVDLLGNELAPRESELVADILIDLIRQAERDLRCALADRLAMLDAAPLRVILQLAMDEIDVARPVLERSPVLSESDLIYIIKSKSAEYWRAIARREDLGGNALDALADTCDLPTAQILVENKSIHLTGHAVDVFGTLARRSAKLAGPLLLRPEVPADLAGALYKLVSEGIQDHVMRKFDLPESVVMGSLDGILKEFSGDTGASGHPTKAMMDMAYSAKEKDLITLPVMLETLGRGQMASFVALMSAYVGIAPEVTLSILEQSSGDRLAGLCRGMGIDRADFLGIFRLTQRLRSNSGVTTGHDLARAQSAFGRIDKAQGEKFLEACRRSAVKK